MSEMKPLVSAAVFFGATVFGGAAIAQGFDCRKAYYADEKLVCREHQLAVLDEQLNAVFRGAMSSLPPGQRKVLEKERTVWILARRRCGVDYGCVEQKYRTRIAELSAVPPPDIGAVPPRSGNAPPARNGPSTAPTHRTSEPADTAPMPIATAIRPTNKRKSPSSQPESTTLSATRSTVHEVSRSETDPAATTARSGAEVSGSTSRSRPSIRWVDPSPAR